MCGFCGGEKYYECCCVIEYGFIIGLFCGFCKLFYDCIYMILVLIGFNLLIFMWIMLFFLIEFMFVGVLVKIKFLVVRVIYWDNVVINDVMG